MWSACLCSENRLGPAKLFYKGAGVSLVLRYTSGSEADPHLGSQETQLWHGINLPIWVKWPWVKRKGG